MPSIQLNFSDISNLESSRLKNQESKYDIYVRNMKKKSSKKLFKKSRNFDRTNKFSSNNEINRSCTHNENCGCSNCEDFQNEFIKKLNMIYICPIGCECHFCDYDNSVCAEYD